MFKPYGDIVEIMMKDDFAFIEFAHIHSAAKALGELNGARLSNQKIQVEEARPQEGENNNAPNHSKILTQMYGKNVNQNKKSMEYYLYILKICTSSKISVVHIFYL